MSRYLLIVVSSFLIGVFLLRCFFICLSCRNLSHENDSINYDHPMNNIDEESLPPPSYEQVINENNHYRLDQC